MGRRCFGYRNRYRSVSVRPDDIRIGSCKTIYRILGRARKGPGSSLDQVTEERKDVLGQAVDFR